MGLGQIVADNIQKLVRWTDSNNPNTDLILNKNIWIKVFTWVACSILHSYSHSHGTEHSLVELEWLTWVEFCRFPSGVSCTVRPHHRRGSTWDFRPTLMFVVWNTPVTVSCLFCRTMYFQPWLWWLCANRVRWIRLLQDRNSGRAVFCCSTLLVWQNTAKTLTTPHNVIKMLTCI